MPESDSKIKRVTVPALEDVLGKKYQVLDDGFVRVIDYMGSDKSIVQAARVSYGAGTKRVREDAGLIRYLMRHGHTTPFEMCELKLHVRVPMDCWRQWIRHRTASVNEYSTRYSVAIDAAQKTQPAEWRRQSTENRQGSSDNFPGDQAKALTASERDLQEHARRVYEERLNAGVAREQARKDLPLSTYTEAYWKTDLHNLFHFLRLRMDEHAQFEIRQYALTIGEMIVSRWCPAAWTAFTDYEYNATRLTVREKEIVKSWIENSKSRVLELAKKYGWIRKDGTVVRNREREEADAKLKSLGLRVNWASLEAEVDQPTKTR